MNKRTAVWEWDQVRPPAKNSTFGQGRPMREGEEKLPKNILAMVGAAVAASTEKEGSPRHKELCQKVARLIEENAEKKVE